jgi:hypothetical protein
VAKLTKQQETSSKLKSIDDWRNRTCQSDEETDVFNKYSFPRDVAVCDLRDTWNVPDALVKQGIPVKRMLPDSALSEIQQLTGVKLVTSCNGRTVYIGASTNAKVTAVKQKLETLARFIVSYETILLSRVTSLTM